MFEIAFCASNVIFVYSRKYIFAFRKYIFEALKTDCCILKIFCWKLDFCIANCKFAIPKVYF